MYLYDKETFFAVRITHGQNEELRNRQDGGLPSILMYICIRNIFNWY